MKTYILRGSIKIQLKDYNGAISDITKSIDIYPNNAIAYFKRGEAKGFLKKDYYGAISDYTKSIELDPNNGDAYYNRGGLKERLGDLSGTCSDMKKSSKLGSSKAKLYLQVVSDCN
tara:strand:+ start:34 stop:381 length:348 start_codon:yes stop_codon:yes gene_type:complete